MNDDLKNLLALQDLDIRIIDLENSKELFPKAVQELEQTIEKARKKIKETEEKLAAAKMEKNKIAEQIVISKHGLERSQERLNLIKTNKEYDAVHAEIESQRHLSEQGERKLLKFSTEIETLEKELNEELNAVDKIVAENQPQIDDLKTKIASINGNITEVVTEREKIVPLIPKNHLRIYEHIRKSRKTGKALSIVSHTQKNCSICYQVLLPQAMNQMRKGKDLVYCQNCGSVLIWEEYIL
jgi:hypothetical protein